MNLLEKYRSEKSEEIEKKKEVVLAERQDLGHEKYGAYHINTFENLEGLGNIKAEYVDRAQFGADVCLTSPVRVSELGPKTYISTEIPKIIEQIQKTTQTQEGQIEKAEQKGMYINLKLSDKFLFATLQDVLNKSGRFGMSDVFKGKSAVVDYSSPNAAKHLHAGHIRSTIIGEVLSNIYESAGYTVHRINHLNDWGGFGFLIEGYDRWANEIEAPRESNELLYRIYLKYREIEKKSEESDEGKKAWDEFSGAARERFKKLEAGEKYETELWQKMVDWSMDEFHDFYKAIGVEHDYTIGESYFAKSGDELVNRALQSGVAKTLSDGAVVIPLGEDEQLVVRRADESSIYATRDLAAIEDRVKIFAPASLLSYVVGEEQTDHFSKLFRAARVLKLLSAGNVAKHLPFGLYIDAETKKKISSRDGAQDVMTLLGEAKKYFEKKYLEREGFTDEERKRNANMLAVGSIAFNDIKKERRFPVEFHREAEKNIEEYEQSGGAYVMYASARAKSILRKYGADLPNVHDVAPEKLEAVEVMLIKKINEFPRIIALSAEMDNPATLAQHLVSLAQSYNSYYEQCPVLNKDGTPEFPHRLIITKAVAQVIDNGLALCHAKGPDRI